MNEINTVKLTTADGTLDGAYMKVVDHKDVVAKVKNKYKPNKDSIFAIRYSYQTELRMVYAGEYKYMIPLLNKLNRNKDISNIHVYALNEVEISHDITVKLPE